MGQGTPISDDGFVKAYSNLYKSYVSAESNDVNDTKDELLDVVDYYLSAPEVSANLNYVGTRSNKMIGRILADSGVDFDCGVCDASSLGDRCCIYRTQQDPTIYECIGSEIVGVTGYVWVNPTIDGTPMICKDGCCRNKCCSKPNQATSTTRLITTTSPSTTTSTTLPGDHCQNDGECYAKYGPCWVCPDVDKNCTKKVICTTGQDCKNRYTQDVDWKCDPNGCCIPPVSLTTTTSSTTTTTLAGDHCQNDMYCYRKYGPCSVCPGLDMNCSKTTNMCQTAQDCKNLYYSTLEWNCDSNKCCIPPAAAAPGGKCTDSIGDPSFTCNGVKGCKDLDGACFPYSCTDGKSKITLCMDDYCEAVEKICDNGCKSDGGGCNPDGPDVFQCTDSIGNPSFTCNGVGGCKGSDGVCHPYYCSDDQQLKHFQCDGDICRDAGYLLCDKGCNSARGECGGCKIITQSSPHQPSCDDGSGNPQENYCAIVNDKAFYFKWGCDVQTGKCIKDTGTLCTTIGAPNECESPVSHSSGSWSHTCKQGTAVQEMFLTVDATSYAKNGGSLTEMLSCKKYHYLQVKAEQTNSAGSRVDVTSYDGKIQITMSSNPAGTFITSPGYINSFGKFYVDYKAPDVSSLQTVTITAAGHDTGSKYKDSASAPATMSVKPNKLVLSSDKTYKLYVYSKRSHMWNDVKSCEDITYSACVVDSDNPAVKPTSDVTVSFKLNDPKTTTAACTVSATSADGCCKVDGKAPNVTAETTFSVEVNATAKQCYTPADKPTSGILLLTVKPVKLVVTSLTATPAKVKIGEKVTVKATVKDDGSPATVMNGINVTFMVGTATGTAVTNAAGEAAADIVAKEPAGKVKVTAKASKKSCYLDSEDVKDTYSPKPVEVEITTPTTTTLR
jgi:hypothetical protein